MIFSFIYFQDLVKKFPDVFKDAVIQGMLEFEWDLFIEAKRKVKTVLQVSYWISCFCIVVLKNSCLCFLFQKYASVDIH